MESAGALIMDFHPPELYEISFCHLEIIQSGLFWQNSPNGLRHTYALLSHGWHWCDTSKGHSLGQPQNHRAGTFHQVPHHQGKLPDFESLRHHAIAKTSLDRGTDPLGPLKRLAFPVLKEGLCSSGRYCIDIVLLDAYNIWQSAKLTWLSRQKDVWGMTHAWSGQFIHECFLSSGDFLYNFISVENWIERTIDWGCP